VGQEIVSVEYCLRCFVVEGPVPKQTLTEAGEDSLALKLLRICSLNVDECRLEGWGGDVRSCEIGVGVVRGRWSFRKMTCQQAN